MPRIRRTFERPPPEDVAALGALGTTLLSDAMGRAGAMHSRLRPVGTAVQAAGPALTVRTYPNDNLMCHIAVTLARPGDILVIDGDNYTEAAVWGEMLTRAALARGVAAVIVDAAARDREAITELGLPVFASAIVPRGTYKGHAGDINVPISCGGLVVEPGDIVVTDADGVVVVPRGRATRVTELARAAADREQDWRRALADGKPLAEIVSLDALIAGIDWE